ncbi:MAG: hypothetical protein KKG60_02165 [Nanoarchaeota archaeon]|nr:hypothetical protein [Nanoarchaeota archaeon]
MTNTITILEDSLADLNWFQENSEELRGKYEEEFVAIKGRSIVAFGPDVEILFRKLKEKRINKNEVLIEFISPKNHIVIL